MIETLKYDCIVMFGQTAFEVPKTTREKLAEEYEEVLRTPVGERAPIRVDLNEATVILDPNVPGVVVQVISKKDFQKRQQAAAGGPQRLVQPVGVVPPNGGRRA